MHRQYDSISGSRRHRGLCGGWRRWVCWQSRPAVVEGHLAPCHYHQVVKHANNPVLTSSAHQLSALHDESCPPTPVHTHKHRCPMLLPLLLLLLLPIAAAAAVKSCPCCKASSAWPVAGQQPWPALRRSSLRLSLPGEPSPVAVTQRCVCVCLCMCVDTQGLGNAEKHSNSQPSSRLSEVSVSVCVDT